jgi:DNA-binding response OmpR family regulator
MSGHAATSASGSPAGLSARLLLAGGDPSLRRVLHRALQAHGYQVAVADTVTTALELAGHEHPDLIVLDLSLPGVVDAIRALRQAQAQVGAPPILLLTWVPPGPTEPDWQAALDAGADDALTKPFGIGQLLDRLQALRAAAALSPSGQDKEQASGADASWLRS